MLYCHSCYKYVVINVITQWLISPRGLGFYFRVLLYYVKYMYVLVTLINNYLLTYLLTHYIGRGGGGQWWSNPIMSPSLRHRAGPGAVVKAACLESLEELFLPHSDVKIQYWGEPPWPRSSVIGFRPPGRISNPVSGGCHLIYLTILTGFSWLRLAYMYTKVT